MGGLRLPAGVWPAFHYGNHLGTKLLRATTNSPLLRCGNRRSGHVKAHRFTESAVPSQPSPASGRGSRQRCFVGRMKTRARQSTPQNGLLLCIDALLPLLPPSTPQRGALPLAGNAGVGAVRADDSRHWQRLYEKPAISPRQHRPCIPRRPDRQCHRCNRPRRSACRLRPAEIHRGWRPRSDRAC
jgi:hypothetical protein